MNSGLIVGRWVSTAALAKSSPESIEERLLEQ